MADATGYDPKNISGITTLYVTPNANAPIYKHPYTTGEIAAFDGFTGGSGYSAGTVTPTGGTGTGATATISVNSGAVNGATIVNKGKNYTDKILNLDGKMMNRRKMMMIRQKKKIVISIVNHQQIQMMKKMSMKKIIEKISNSSL